MPIQGSSRRCRGKFMALTAFGAAALSMLALSAAPARACPFCGSVQSTLAQDIKGSDVAVVAKLVALPVRTETKDGELNVATPMAKFEIREVLKGADALAGAKLVEAPFFDEKPLGGEYLILGATAGRRLGAAVCPHAAQPQICFRDR